MENLQELLSLHKEWLEDNTKGKRLDLSDASLSYADLSCADLRGADLRYANLSCADLRGANLSYADLRSANLSYANLSYADLRGADLRYCIGNNKEVKSLQIGTYLVSYTKDILNIGCQFHSIEKWESFNNNDIVAMDGEKALEWWILNKNTILTLVKREAL